MYISLDSFLIFSFFSSSFSPFILFISFFLSFLLAVVGLMSLSFLPLFPMFNESILLVHVHVIALELVLALSSNWSSERDGKTNGIPSAQVLYCFPCLFFLFLSLFPLELSSIILSKTCFPCWSCWCCCCLTSFRIFRFSSFAGCCFSLFSFWNFLASFEHKQFTLEYGVFVYFIKAKAA